MKNGDIYFWSWKNPPGDFPYYGKSRKAVVIDDELRDNLLYFLVPLDQVEIEYKGNINELETIPPKKVHYYRKIDVVDMRSSTGEQHPVYIQPGAKRDPQAMCNHIYGMINKGLEQIEAIKRKNRLLERDVRAIGDGRLEDVR